jgi:hypothetical protein
VSSEKKSQAKIELARAAAPTPTAKPPALKQQEVPSLPPPKQNLQGRNGKEEKRKERVI